MGASGLHEKRDSSQCRIDLGKDKWASALGIGGAIGSLTACRLCTKAELVDWQATSSCLKPNLILGLSRFKAPQAANNKEPTAK